MINPRGILSLIPMLRFSVALIIGIFLGDAMLHYITPVEWFSAAVLSCVVGIMIMDRKVIGSILVFLTVLYLGAMSISLHESDIPEYVKRHLCCEGVIISEPIQRGKVVQCDILLTKGWLSHPSKVRASIRTDSIGDSLMVGTTLRWISTVQRPHEGGGHDNRNFSYVRWMHIHGYEANVFLAAGKWTITTIDLSSLSLWQKIKIHLLTARSRMLHKMRVSYIDDDSFAVVAAMTLGDKVYLNKTQKDIYSVAGAAHILALSGMHIGIIMFLLTAIFRGKRNVYLQLFGVISVWLFVIFVGLPVSSVRAALMITIWCFLHTCNRDQHPLNVLGCVAFIIIIINPEIVFDVGFQMSFMSVFFIFMCMPSLQKLRPFKPKERKKRGYHEESVQQKIWFWIYSLLCISCVAQLGTLPLTICYFGRIPCYFLLTNLIILPLSVIVIYTTLVYVFSILLGLSISSDIACVINFIMKIMNGTVKIISDLPGASIEGIDINSTQAIILYGIMGISFVLFVKIKHRPI